MTDALVLSRSADGVVMVIRAGETAREMAKNSVTQLNAIGANILGAVLNGVEMGRDSYYYYQYYYYYYGEDGEKRKKVQRKRRSKSRYSYGSYGDEEAEQKKDKTTEDLGSVLPLLIKGCATFPAEDHQQS